MRIPPLLILASTMSLGVLTHQALGQAAAPPLSQAEPGLEEAVKWKWSVESSLGSEWGLSAPGSDDPDPSPTSTPESGDVGTYTVKKGDALILIAKRHKISVEHLKLANGLTGNLIRVGDVLRIPTAEEIALMPVTTKPGQVSTEPGIPIGVDAQTLLFQVYLDRLGFSPGPITGKPSPAFDKLMYVFQVARGGIMDIDALREAANREVGPMVTTYRLKVSDFRFIEPPPNFQSAPSGQKGKPTAAKALTYDELLSRPMLTYRNPWEFVAERFHCDETFLRALNPTIRGTPAPGTEFRVPNVKPFLIEDSLPPQPPQGSTPDISAAVVDLSRLEIYQSDKLVACFPVASARPGLRGRGTWVILDAIPRPRLTTFREPREQPKPVASFYAGPTPTPQPPPLLAEKEILHAGPRNPVGILWINLAKSDDPTPLPFGLHGSGAPSRMTTHSGLGGFRMTNWDIARAIPYLAPGTVLSWRQSPPPQIAPARPAEAVVPAPAIPEAVPPQPHPTP